MKKFFSKCKNYLERVFFWKPVGKISGMFLACAALCVGLNLYVTAIPLALVGAITLGMSIEGVMEDDRILKDIKNKEAEVSDYIQDKEQQEQKEYSCQTQSHKSQEKELNK